MPTVRSIVSQTILIVEDDEKLAGALRDRLVDYGCMAVIKNDGDDAIKYWSQNAPQIILLDLDVPGASGWDLLEAKPSLPPAIIIVITGSTDIQTRVNVLDAGASDYLPKPFYTEELVARIKLRLKSAMEPPSSEQCKMVFKGIALLPGKRLCQVNAEEIELTQTEFDILMHFMKNRDRVVTREMLLETIFHDTGERFDRSVDAHISRLRKKLGGARNYIETVWGLGWRLC